MTAAPAPGSTEWMKLVTASKVAAILGVSPHDSPRSMWHRMRGELPNTEATPAMQRGNYLEDGILDWWQDQHPEYTHMVRQYYATRPDMPWAAATPDGYATGPNVHPVTVDAKSIGDASYGWGEPGTDQVPDHYRVSSEWQMMLAGTRRTYLAVLFGKPQHAFAEYVIDADPVAQQAIANTAKTFYDSLTADECPLHLDDSVATYEALRRVNPYFEGDIQVPADLAAEYLAALDAEEAATRRARLAKNRILSLMRTARTGSVGGVVVCRRQPTRGDAVSLRRVAKSLPEQEYAA